MQSSREGQRLLAIVSIGSGCGSIHWHGILLPANMDGVPGLSYRGIAKDTRLVAGIRLWF